MNYASSREAVRSFAVQTLAPLVATIEGAFAMSVLSSAYQLQIKLNSLTRGDPEARWANWQRARRAGILTANEIRGEQGWPAVADGHDLAPSAIGGKRADDTSPELDSKIALFPHAAE